LRKCSVVVGIDRQTDKQTDDREMMIDSLLLIISCLNHSDANVAEV